MSPRMTPPPPSRRGFTIIELLIVIVIISILVGMLLAGIAAVWPTVRAAEVNVEISGFESGITQFAGEFGAEPPSGITLHEAPAGWNSDPQSTQSRTIIQGLWPKFDFLMERDLNLDGDKTDTFVLTGDECLLFFLGGPDTIVFYDGAEFGDKNGDGFPDRPVADGFSQNPTNPFASGPFGPGGSRVGPFQEFDPARMIDYEEEIGGEKDGVHSYSDAFPSTQVPYLYLSSYGGRGYRARDRDMNGNGTVDTNPTPQESPELNSEYFQSGGVAWKENSYQIISAGVDGVFGVGGEWSSDERFGSDPARRTETKFDSDNVTNFSGGTLD